MKFYPLNIIISLLVLVPNLIYVFLPPKNVPAKYDNRNKTFTLIEKIGQIGVVILPILFKLHFTVFPTIIAVLSLAIYYYCWIRYAVRGREYIYLFDKLLFVPIPMAIFPIMYFICVSILLSSWIYFGVVVIFTVGHLYESWISYKSINEDGSEKSIMRLIRGIFYIFLVLTIATKFEAVPFSTGSHWDWSLVWSLKHEITVGVLCSAVLALFIEHYHEKKDERLAKLRKQSLLEPVFDIIKKLEGLSSIRCKIIAELDMNKEVDDTINGFQQSENIEAQFLRNNNGVWEDKYKFIFVSDEEYKEYKKEGTVKFDNQTDFISFINLTLRYRDCLNVLNQLYEELCGIRIDRLKTIEVITLPEYNDFNLLIGNLEDFYSTYPKNNGEHDVLMVASINKFNIIIQKLNSIYIKYNES